MMKNKLGLRVMPLAWLVFSVVYLLFAMSIEPRRMPADREGWDPGSNAIPVGIGYLMVAVSAYVVITDRKRQPTAADTDKEKEPTTPAPVEGKPVADGAPHGALPGVRPTDIRALVLLTIGVSVAYILVFRNAGFIVSTTVLMMTLTYFYAKQAVRIPHMPEYLRSLSLVLVSNVLLYSLARWIIRWTQYYGRIRDIAFLRNRLVTALLAMAAWAAVGAPLYLLVRRRIPLNGATGLMAALISCVTTLGLYLVFQQVFRVALPGGFIAW